MEVSVDMTGQEGVIGIIEVLILLLFDPARHSSFPFGAVFLDLLLVVEFSVVVLAHAAEALPERQVLGVNGGPVIIIRTATANAVPPTFLLLQVKTSGIRKEEEGKDHATESKPRDNVELGLRVDVVVENGGQQSTAFTGGGRETVRRSANRGRVNLGSDEEGDRVRTKLVEERAQEVHGLEGFDVCRARVELVVESGDDEKDEVHKETHHLHPFAAIEFVVDEERSQVIATQRHAHVAQVPKPGGHD